MASWILFSILAPLVWALGNIIDKFVVTRFTRKPITFTTFMGLIIGLLSIFIIIFKGLTLPAINLSLLSLLAGMLYFFGIYYFIKCLTFEEVSRLIPLWRFGAIFTLILAVIFLNERLSVQDYIAFILLVVGGILISLKKMGGLFIISKALVLMILSSLILSIYRILSKYIYSIVSYWDGFILIQLGVFITALCFLFIKNVRNDFAILYREMNIKIKGALVGSEILNFLGLLSSNYAVFLGPVSLVTALTGIQPLFTLVFASIVSIRFPSLFKEEIKPSIIILKIIAIVLITIGVWLTSV